MHQVIARFDQHSVGQGGFHAASLWFVSAQGYVDSHPFRYVYDCGRANTKPRQWDHLLRPFIEASGTNPLDALFISHFDSDHVNGLPSLLEACNGAKKVFLPYLSPTERLLLGVRSAARGNEIAPDYLKFLNDPVAFLSQRGAQKIYLVGGSPGDLPRPGEPLRPRIPEALEPLPPEAYVVEKDEPPSELDIQPWEVENLRRAGVLFLNHDNAIDVTWPGLTTQSVWELQTYVDQDSQSRDEINNMVRQYMTDKDYSSLVNGEVYCSAILRDPVKLSRLQDAYRSAGARRRFAWIDRTLNFARPGRARKRADRSWMNRTTMSLFSAPLDAPFAPISLHFLGQYADGVRILGKRSGWLLTGDAVLREDGVLQRFSQFFGAYRKCLDRVLIFSLPHHGSAANFDSAILCSLGHPPVCVVAAGNRGMYGHPDPDLLRDLRRGSPVYHVHDAPASRLVHLGVY